jgi:NAD(P)H-flavin reductase
VSTQRVTYKLQISHIKDPTPTIREVRLDLQNQAEFTFKAGQFATLHVPQEQKPALRAYSIASSEQDTTGFTLIFKYVDNGVASNYIWSRKVGDVLNFTGPFGRVFFKEPPTEQIVFLNTGSGITQHYCYLLSKKHLYPNLKYRLLFGVRSEKDIYFENELKALQTELPNFKFEYVLSRPSQEWQGKKGYVQNFIEEFDYLNTPTTFYLCGNGAMIKEVKTKLIEQQGFDKQFIFSEAFD